MPQRAESGPLLLLRDGGNALDGQDHRQNHQQDAQNRLDIGTPVGAAGGDQSDLVLGVDQQRADGDNQHEAHGNQEHLVVLADVPQPGGHGQQAQSRQQLVGGAEQRPDLLVAVQAQHHAQHHGDAGGDVHVGEDLLVTGDVLRGLALAGVQPELLEHEPGQPGGGVQGGQAESGVRQHQQGV